MPNRSVLIMSRGMRLHGYFREMAQTLRDDYEVVVTATEEELPAWKEVDGVESLLLDDVEFGRRYRPAPGDAERVREIESRYGFPLYRAASNYLLYKKLAMDYAPYGFTWEPHLETEERIAGALLRSHEVLGGIFEKYEPKAIFTESFDLVSVFLAVHMALEADRFMFGFRHSILGEGRIDLVFGFHRANIASEYLYEHPELISPDAWEEADERIRSYEGGRVSSSYAANYRTMIERRAPGVVSALTRPATMLRSLRHPGLALRRFRGRRWLERHLGTDRPSSPYLFYPLQYQPEATTCSHTPRWVDQAGIVQQLAINAPHGWRIAVKEHPRNFGSRAEEYFGPLLNFPNVDLIHPRASTPDLLMDAAAVFTITGSTGFEGILMGRPVVTLGRPFYAAFPGIGRVEHPDRTFDALEGHDPSDFTEERRRYIAAYIDSLYPWGEGSKHSLFLPERGGDRLAAAFRDTLDFVERHGLTPDQFHTGLERHASSVPELGASA